ncbi:hypothetical protein MBANPS3_007066 [Mucor bainieri]
MKTRSKKRKRVVIYIKQEKPTDGSQFKTTTSLSSKAYKSDPHIKKEAIQGNLLHHPRRAASATSSSSSSSSSSTTTLVRGKPEGTLVKQETTEKYNPLSSSGKFDGREYYYCCRLCDKEMPSLRAVLDHRRTVHAVGRGTVTTIKDVDLEPDVQYPNSYCKSCDKTYTLYTYRHHLESVHHMVLKPLPRTKIQNDKIPDPNNPDCHCASCDHKYSSKWGLLRHCQTIHGMENARLKKVRQILSQPKETLPDLHDPDFFCKTCGITSRSKKQFRSHCYHVHKMRPLSLRPPRLKTGQHISTSLKYYCYVCSRPFCEKRQLHKHLFVMHCFDDISLNQPSDKKPDIDDPKLYCCVCNRSYTNRVNFKTHVRAVHSVGVEDEKKKKLQPDVDDPDDYCRVCDRKYASKRKYRNHLRFVHFMVLKAPTAYNPKKFPDPNDPNLYCYICKRHYKNKT